MRLTLTGGESFVEAVINFWVTSREPHTVYGIPVARTLSEVMTWDIARIGYEMGEQSGVWSARNRVIPSPSAKLCHAWSCRNAQ